MWPEKRKKHRSDQNTEPIPKLRHAFCIIFWALSDGGKLPGPSGAYFGPFGKMSKNDEKSTGEKTQYRPYYRTNLWIDTSILHHFLCSFQWKAASRMIPGWFRTFRKKCQKWRKKFTRNRKKTQYRPEYKTNPWMETGILHHFLSSFRWQEASGTIRGSFRTFRKNSKNHQKFTQKL